MMAQNYKDELYKFCQKFKLSNPGYKTDKSGTEHEPIYLSSVITDDGSFLGETCRTKKLAEASAALSALEYYKSKDKSLNSKNKACLLINGENTDMIDNEINLKVLSCENLDIYIFVDYDIVYRKFPDKINKIITSNNNLHSRDICMSAYIGSFLTKGLYDIYFIATSSEFANVLVDMIQDGSLDWINKKAYHITKIEQIY
jgi:hypothetical protein